MGPISQTEDSSDMENMDLSPDEWAEYDTQHPS
jgi:hypothetical protein